MGGNNPHAHSGLGPATRGLEIADSRGEMIVKSSAGPGPDPHLPGVVSDIPSEKLGGLCRALLVALTEPVILEMNPHGH